jgi:hypothetical protein
VTDAAVFTTVRYVVVSELVPRFAAIVPTVAIVTLHVLPRRDRPYRFLLIRYLAGFKVSHEQAHK